MLVLIIFWCFRKWVEQLGHAALFNLMKKMRIGS